MAWTAALGLGMNALGGMLSGGSQDQSLANAAQQAQWQPTDINAGGLGSFTSTGQGGYNMNLGQFGQGLAGAAGPAALSALQSGQSYGNQFMGTAGGAIDPAFAYLNQMLGQQLPTQEFGAQNQALQGAMSSFMNQGGGALQAGLGGLQGNMGTAFGMGQDFLGQAGGMLGQAGNVQGLIDDRYAALSAQAAPGEERQYNSLQNKLFSQGRLGSTGGSRDIEAFARGLGEADLSRQMAAQDLGLRTSSTLQQGAGIAGGLGSGLFNQGFGAAGQLGGFGQGLMSQGLGFGQQGLENTIGLQDIGISRGQQRLSNATNLFGFGQNTFGGGIQNAQGATGLYNSAYAPLFDLGNLSMRGSEGRGLGDRAAAGYQSEQMGSGGLFGGGLSAFGSGLFNMFS